MRALAALRRLAFLFTATPPQPQIPSQSYFSRPVYKIFTTTPPIAKRRMTCPANTNIMMISFLDQEKATLVDVKLMSPQYGFGIDQLMELAGLAVAHAAVQVFPIDQHPHIAIVCGPGNNGGDGLVAARHLFHFGYRVSVIYPKRPVRPPFQGLVTQLQVLVEPNQEQDTNSSVIGVEFCDVIPDDVTAVVDAVFGFSFKPDPQGGVREPYKALLAQMNDSKYKVLCVDVPSGWDVDRGNIYDESVCIRDPYAIISLTLPKRGVATYKGIHYVGGRFVPPMLAKELELQLPEYPGIQGIVRIS